MSADPTHTSADFQPKPKNNGRDDRRDPPPENKNNPKDNRNDGGADDYKWKHYYKAPKLKDFEPSGALSAKMDGAPKPKPRVFKDVTPGEMIGVLFHEAQARGALRDLRLSFNKEKDSAGIKWPSKPHELLHHRFAAGTTLLEVLRWLEHHKLAEARMHKRRLQLFVPGHDPVHDDPTVLLAKGRNLIDGPTQRTSRDLATHLYVLSENGVHGWVRDKKSARRYGRIEQMHSINSVRKWDQAENRGSKILDRMRDPRVQMTYGVVPDHGANPYKDFEAGDVIYVLENGVPTQHRVRQVGLTWDDSGTVAISLTLSDVILAPDIKDHRGRGHAWRAVDSHMSAAAIDERTLPDEHAPKRPSKPLVTARGGTLRVQWDGKDEAGIPPVFDHHHVEIHMSDKADFTPTEDTVVDSLALTGAAMLNAEPYDTERFFKFVSVDEGGDRSVASEEVSFATPLVDGYADLAGNTIPVAALSDLRAPDTSPTPTVTGGIGALYLRWPASVNADPVTYDLYMDLVAIPDPPLSITRYTSTTANSLTVKTMPDGTPLQYFQAWAGDPLLDPKIPLVYHFKMIARDADGGAPAGAEVTGSPIQITGPDIAADSVSANHIQTGTLTGDLFSGQVVLGSTLSTRSYDPVANTFSGAGVDLSNAGDYRGFYTFDSSGSPRVEFPIDPLAPDVFRGNAEIDALETKQSASLAGQTTVQSGGVVSLALGVSPPGNQPGLTSTYAQTQFTGDWSNKRGLAYDGTYWYSAYTDGGFEYPVKYDNTGKWVNTGVKDRAADETFGVQVIGSSLYVLSHAYNSYWVRRYFLGLTWQDSAEWTGSVGSTRPALGQDPATGELLIAQARTSDGAVMVKRYTYPTGGGTLQVGGATVTADYNYPFDLAYVDVGAFDFAYAKVGSSFVSITSRSLTSNVATITTSAAHGFTVGQSVIVTGVSTTTFDGTWTITAVTSTTFSYARTAANVSATPIVRYVFARPNGQFTQVCTVSGTTLSQNPYNESWDDGTGVNIVGFDYVNGQFKSMDVGGILRTYESGNRWTVTTESDWYVAYAWYSSTGPAMSIRSPVANISMTQRSRLRVQTATLPTGASGARIYLKKGPVTARGQMSLQTNVPSGTPPVATITNGVFSGVTTDLLVTTFGTASPAQIVSQGGGYQLKADGTGVWPDLESRVTAAAHSDAVSVANAAVNALPTGRPIGEITMWGGVNAPSGWFLCDGSLKDKNTWPELYAVLGTRYGGDGSPNFALPDLVKRMPRGNGDSAVLASNDGYTQANRTSAHNHGTAAVTTTDATVAHTHTIDDANHTARNDMVATGTSQAIKQIGSLGATSHAHGGHTSTPEASTAHNHGVAGNVGMSSLNDIPFLTVNFIIRAAVNL